MPQALAGIASVRGGNAGSATTCLPPRLFCSLRAARDRRGHMYKEEADNPPELPTAPPPPGTIPSSTLKAKHSPINGRASASLLHLDVDGVPLVHVFPGGVGQLGQGKRRAEHRHQSHAPGQERTPPAPTSDRTPGAVQRPTPPNPQQRRCMGDALSDHHIRTAGSRAGGTGPRSR